MNSRTVKLEESGLEMRSGRRMIFKILDTQINNYKLQFITDWEGNHDLSPDEKDEKIAKMRIAHTLRNCLANIYPPEI